MYYADQLIDEVMTERRLSCKCYWKALKTDSKFKNSRNSNKVFVDN